MPIARPAAQPVCEAGAPAGLRYVFAASVRRPSWRAQHKHRPLGGNDRTSSFEAADVRDVAGGNRRVSLRSITRAHRGLLGELELTAAISNDSGKCRCGARAVSEWTVQQHLEHLVLADRGILGWLDAVRRGEVEASDSGKPTLPGRLVLLLGLIPRGKGRAPDFAVPKNVEMTEIRDRLAAVRQLAEDLTAALPMLAESRCTRRHHLLGHYIPTQWLRFANIHHVHHGKIIREVLAHGGVR